MAGRVFVRGLEGERYDLKAHRQQRLAAPHVISEEERSWAIAFLCECASERCFETVWQTPEEYEAVHLDARSSVLAPGHRE